MSNLTLDEWKLLPEEEKKDRYKELSDHDRFVQRITAPPSGVGLICNDCKHRLFNRTGKVEDSSKCDAFPEKIPFAKIIENGNQHDTEIEGDNGIRYEKMEK